MEIKGNQNIFDFTLEKFGTLENLFDDVLVPNFLPIDQEIKPNQDVNINAVGKGDDDVKMKISEQGLSMTNGDITIIIEYRNGIVTNAVEGATAIFDFEAKINSSTPVVFTVNWGIEIGISIVIADMVNGVWKALQTSILIPVGVDLSQTIMVTDNFGGSYQLGYVIEAQKTIYTLDMSSPSTAGFNHTFTGSLSINFNDGVGVEALTSGVEKSNTYTTPGIKTVEVSGDRENITTLIADNSKITSISNLTTGLMDHFNIRNNLYNGALDLSNAPVKSLFRTFSNINLNNINFATSGNGLMTSVTLYSCDLTTLDFSNLPLSNQIRAYSNPNLTSVTFATSANGLMNDVWFSTCNLSIIDFSNLPLSGVLRLNSNPNLTFVTFATSGNGTLTTCVLFGCDFLALDFSNIKISNNFRIYDNPNLTSLTFAGAGNGVLVDFYAYNCYLPNIDFSVFPTSDGVVIRLFNNNFTSTEHDNQLINLDATGWVNGFLEIIAGNTTRTAASDAAYNSLIAKGWIIT